MRLNHDLVRLLLIAIGETDNPMGFTQEMGNQFIAENNITINKYAFMINKLKEAEFITGYVRYGDDTPYFYVAGNLTFSGNEYLDTIENPETWVAVKQIASTAGNISLSMMQQLAVSYVKNKLGI